MQRKTSKKFSTEKLTASELDAKLDSDATALAQLIYDIYKQQNQAYDSCIGDKICKSTHKKLNS